MAIYLVRHAESEANINGRTSSHASIQLSDQGLVQAKQLIEQLPKIDGVMVSQYLRTYQTAQPIMNEYQIDPIVDENLHEFSYLSEAKCANTTLQERKQWVNDYWEKGDIHHQDALDAESFVQFYARVKTFAEKLKSLLSEYTVKNLLVVSHGQFIQLLIMYINQNKALTPQLMQDFRSALLEYPIKNAEIFHYSFNGIARFDADKARVEKSKS